MYVLLTLVFFHYKVKKTKMQEKHGNLSAFQQVPIVKEPKQDYNKSIIPTLGVFKWLF